jgi:hypothetical protein
MAAPVAFEYHQNAQKTFQPPLIANENAFLGDVFTSESNDPQAPISAGFYRLEKGKRQKTSKKPDPKSREQHVAWGIS